MKKIVISLIVIVAALVLINYGASKWYERFDLTKDQRYTLSPVATQLAESVESTMLIDVFLDGELPPEFRKLQSETQQLLEEYAAVNKNIKFNFVNPTEDESTEAVEQITMRLAQYGIKPAMATIMEGGKSTKVVVFPWAIMVYNGKTTAVPLLKTVARATMEERVNSSIQQLEYQFADGMSKVINEKSKTIAVLRDSGELSDLQIRDFIKTLQQYYRVAPFGIEFVKDNDSVTPVDVLNQLNKFDLIIEPKPTVAFSETKNYIIDQYIMDGGKMLLAADPIIFENDSLANPQSIGYGMPRDLNLDNLLFKYGLRLNNGIVKDERAGGLALATGQGRNTQYEAFDWPYYPISKSDSDNPITKNLEEVKFEYTGTIDTLKNSIKKTVLLSTSPDTQIKILPAAISLAELDQPIDPLATKVGEKPLAVLAEGSFTSAYKNRVKPFEMTNSIDEGKESAIVLIADGDVLKNQIDSGKAQELGYDMRTGALYGNKEFLMNTVNYLLDDTGLIQLRSKNITVPFLNLKKSYDERTKWQLINVLLPLITVVIFGLVFNYLRRKKYSA
ncbi:gliding motility-associated ABC transporter substrate-binding protein GldG [Nonlabens sp. Asnod3-H03]|uniref:gliding motility-associated ABC transporter substrate-binding protein GldG n=1 Tax=Nonlabens sp. Asnod3-H03 TaxID=3160580 RepID=UPI00386C1201